jgi:hypothetical protein
LTTQEQLENASVPNPSVGFDGDLLLHASDDAEWWITEHPVEIAGYESECYADSVDIILETHDRNICRGLKTGEVCDLCNIKLGSSSFGAWTRKLGEWIESDPSTKVHVEVDFDPAEFDRQALYNIAQDVLKNYKDPNDQILG